MPGSSAESNRSLPVTNPFGDETVATQSNAPKEPNQGPRAAKQAHTTLVSRAPWAGLRLPTPSEAPRRPGPQHRQDRGSRFGSPGPLPGSAAPSSSSVSPPEPPALRGRSPRVSLQQPQWRTKGNSGQRREQKRLLQLEVVAAIQGLTQDTSGGGGTQGTDLGPRSSVWPPTQLRSPQARPRAQGYAQGAHSAAQPSREAGAIMAPSVRVGKVRCREVRQLAQGHPEPGLGHCLFREGHRPLHIHHLPQAPNCPRKEKIIVSILQSRRLGFGNAGSNSAGRQQGEERR